MKRRRHRQQVTMRVKVRQRRHKRLAAAFIFVAGVSAALTVASRVDVAARAKRITAPLTRVAGYDASAVPAQARADVERELRGWTGRAVGPFEARAAEKRLAARLGYVEDLSLSRSWLSRSVTASGKLKVAAGRTTDGAWVGTDGTRFKAPAGLYRDTLPVVDADAARDFKAAATFLKELDGRLPMSKLTRAGEDGWTVELIDGMRLKWGGLERTDEKLAKLVETLDDAKRRFPRLASADLRFFEDGRILVQPAASVAKTR